MIKYKGSCRCGRVSFQIVVSRELELPVCDCTRCRQQVYQHLLVGCENLSLVSGYDCLTSYGLDTPEVKHLFCSCCGQKCFYIPLYRKNMNSVNAHCLRPPRGR